MRRVSLPYAVVFCLAGLPALGRPAPPKAPASPPTLLSNVTAESFAEILKDAGYRAEVRQSEANKAPYILTGVSGRKAAIDFYGCRPEGCRSIQYRLSFSKSPKLTLELCNAWNRKKRFAKAYIDGDGDLMLEWDVDFEGGITPAYLRRSIDTFEGLVAEFDKFLP